MEFGFGDGRDLALFLERGFECVGLEASKSSVAFSADLVEAYGSAQCQLRHLAFSKNNGITQDEIDNLGLISNGGKLAFYARFFLHAIDSGAEARVFSDINKLKMNGAQLALEFRSTGDKKIPKIFDNHDRRFIDGEKLKKELESSGWRIDFFRTGKGLARFGEEDPEVTRVLATNQG